MAQDQQFEDEIVGVTRLRSSAFGNPRFQVRFRDHGSFPTQVDGSVGYGIENREFRSPNRVIVTMRRDQVIGVKQVES